MNLSIGDLALGGHGNGKSQGEDDALDGNHFESRNYCGGLKGLCERGRVFIRSTEVLSERMR